MIYYILGYLLIGIIFAGFIHDDEDDEWNIFMLIIGWILYIIFGSFYLLILVMADLVKLLRKQFK